MTTVVDDVASVPTWLRHSASGRGQSGGHGADPAFAASPPPANAGLGRSRAAGRAMRDPPRGAGPDGTPQPHMRTAEHLPARQAGNHCRRMQHGRFLRTAPRPSPTVVCGPPPPRPDQLPVAGNQLSGSFPPSSPGSFLASVEASRCRSTRPSIYDGIRLPLTAPSPSHICRGSRPADDPIVLRDRRGQVELRQVESAWAR